MHSRFVRHARSSASSRPLYSILHRRAIKNERARPHTPSSEAVGQVVVVYSRAFRQLAPKLLQFPVVPSPSPPAEVIRAVLRLPEGVFLPRRQLVRIVRIPHADPARTPSGEEHLRVDSPGIHREALDSVAGERFGQPLRDQQVSQFGVAVRRMGRVRQRFVIMLSVRELPSEQRIQVGQRPRLADARRGDDPRVTPTDQIGKESAR
mmetsp:Transcript_23229/g.49672  ORF Transcript_23229/g.49672 Transcript_23229/m.49672 type:complete len:207 (+) Transcript_23229:269-889(+)